MALIHGSYSMWHYFIAALFFFGWQCAAMDLAAMDVALGKAVEKALIKCEITITQACDLMRIQEAHFRKALKGEGYRRLQLNHLVRLGPLFLVHLFGEVMWLTAKQRAAEILETVTDVRTRA